MNKQLVIFAFLFLIIGFASAQEAGQMGESGEPEGIMPIRAELNMNGDGMGYQATAGIGISRSATSGEYRNEFGNTYRIQMEGDGYMINSEGVSANCTGCNMSQEQDGNRTRLRVALSNGQKAEIKVMPNTASETALAQLRLRVCNESCEIELKEVGNGNQTRLAYEVRAEKQARFLGIFNTNMSVSTDVDAETGEVIKTKRPWWSFLASQQEE